MIVFIQKYFGVIFGLLNKELVLIGNLKRKGCFLGVYCLFQNMVYCDFTHHIGTILFHKCKWKVKKTFTHFKTEISHYLSTLKETRNNKA